MAACRNVLILLLAFTSITAWSDIKSKETISREAKAKVTHISSEQLAGLLTGADDFILLDIRTEKEFAAGHIKKAQWFPRGNLEFYIQESVTDPAARIVLYCRSGGRSALAALTLKSMGYTNVVDLDGGFKQWLADGNTFYNVHGEHRVVSYQKQE